MNSKHILTISILMIASGILTGCASYGDDQNYRELERNERPERFYTEPATQSEPAHSQIALASQDDEVEIILADAGGNAEAEQDQAAEPNDQKPAENKNEDDQTEKNIDKDLDEVQKEIDELEKNIKRIEQSQTDQPADKTDIDQQSEKPNKRRVISFSEPVTVTIPGNSAGKNAPPTSEKSDNQAQLESEDNETSHKPTNARKPRKISFSEPVSVTVPGKSAEAKTAADQIDPAPEMDANSENIKTQPETDENTETDKAEDDMHDAQSLNGLDRSHWPQIRFSSAEGSTVHQPTYVDQIDRGKDRRNVLDVTDNEKQLQFALADNQAENYSSDNLFDFVSAPVISACELVTAPFKMFSNPPMADVATPERNNHADNR